MYLDTAVADYWRALALPYEASMLALGGEIYVKKATVEYHASARLDDTLDVGMQCTRIGNSSCLFTAGIFCGDRLLISAELVYVFADPATQTSRPVPPALRAIFEGFEAGAEMAEVRTGDWNTLGRDAGRVRTEVFVHEQGIPAEVEADRHDISARHAVLYNRLGMPDRCGPPAAARHPAWAASAAWRWTGRCAVRSGAANCWMRWWTRRVPGATTEVQLHAQRSAEGFYRRAGFTVVGEPYEEAGIAHIAMARRL